MGRELLGLLELTACVERVMFSRSTLTGRGSADRMSTELELLGC